MNNSDQYNISIVTFCMDDWGGSEELWARSIPFLKENISLTLYKSQINKSHPEMMNLIRQRVKLVELAPELPLIFKIFRKANYLTRKVMTRSLIDDRSMHTFSKALKKTMPDLVIIAQGINFDGLAYAYQCLLLKIPYVIIAQKAVDFYWPYPRDRAYMKETLLQAQKCYFVSNQNKRLTEEQFGIRLPNSKVVSNPVKTSNKILPFPDTRKGYRLACVARLFIIDKGQDILLRILSQDKWRNRSVTVSFVGSGHDEEGIKDLMRLLDVKNVEFVGFVEQIENLWADYHALILPSRSEGLPLSMIEAMALGRTVIVSNAGGNAEMITDGLNGFIGDATESDFDNAMERAWENREKWHEIGTNGHQYIQENFTVAPESEFGESINSLLT